MAHHESEPTAVEQVLEALSEHGLERMAQLESERTVASAALAETTSLDRGRIAIMIPETSQCYCANRFPVLRQSTPLDSFASKPWREVVEPCRILSVVAGSDALA
jgi:hypothetical protein